MGIDITPENIKIFKKKALESGLKNVVGKVGDATKLENIPNESFDVVLCLGPLYHLPPNERELVFAECRRICKNGGIFVSIVAWASYQRSEDETPYWRTLKANGELNVKYPNGIEAQKEKLEAEGHTIIQKGRKNIRYYVKGYENFLFDLK